MNSKMLHHMRGPAAKLPSRKSMSLYWLGSILICAMFGGVGPHTRKPVP